MKITIKSHRHKIKQLQMRNGALVLDLNSRQQALINAKKKLMDTLAELQKYKNRVGELEQERYNLIKDNERLNNTIQINTQRI